MIRYKTPEEIAKMRAASRIVADTLHLLRERIRPGVTTLELDEVARDHIASCGGTPLFYRYRGFPAHCCISINDEVVHGIPRRRRRLAEGDLVSVDVGVRHRGYCGDSAWTFPVGEVSAEAQALLEVGRVALYRGIEACRVGGRISDIGRAIQEHVEGSGFYVVKSFFGHGIGKELHEDPHVPNFVDRSLGRDPELRPGLVLAIEPMVNAGGEEVVVRDDGWTVITADRRLSVHFEHTVAVTLNGPEILTLREGELEP